MPPMKLGTILKAVFPFAATAMICFWELFLPHTARSDSASPQIRPLILVSIEPQAFFVAELAGDAALVVSLIPKGASAETFEPTIRQLQVAERAQAYFTLGHPRFPFEALWVNRLRELAPTLRIIPTFTAGYAPDADTHVWLSPRLVGTMLSILSSHLAELLPHEKSRIDAKRTELLKRLAALEQLLRKRFAPYAGRSFLVFHPAWEYLAREYGLKQIAIERDGKEPGPAQLADLIEQAKRERIRVIFIEPQFPRSSADMIAAELGASVQELDGLSYDWFSTMEQVSQALVRSFEGAP